MGLLFFCLPLVACTRLYKPLCRSVGPSVRRSVGPSVGRSVGPSVRWSVGPSVPLDFFFRKVAYKVACARLMAIGLVQFCLFLFFSFSTEHKTLFVSWSLSR